MVNEPISIIYSFHPLRSTASSLVIVESDNPGRFTLLDKETRPFYESFPMSSSFRLAFTDRDLDHTFLLISLFSFFDIFSVVVLRDRLSWCQSPFQGTSRHFLRYSAVLYAASS